MSAVTSLCFDWLPAHKFGYLLFISIERHIAAGKLPVTWPITLVSCQSSAVAVADLDDIVRSWRMDHERQGGLDSSINFHQQVVGLCDGIVHRRTLHYAIACVQYLTAVCK